TDLDHKDTGWRAFGGRRFGRNFALGVGYADLGRIEASGTVPAPVDFVDRVEGSGLEVAATGIWPIKPRIELYGTVSYLSWDQEVRTTVTGQPLRFDASGGAAGVGGGLNFWWRENLALTADARRYGKIGDRAETGREQRRALLAVGITFRFGE